MKYFPLSLVLFLSLSSLFSAVQAQTAPEKADALLNRYLELKRFSGTALVATDQHLLFSKGYGMADYEQGVPIDQHTRFYIAGLTEQLSAYIALKVAEQQGLSLQAPISKYSGALAFPHAERITLHQLLTHTSGLPDYPLIHELPEHQFTSKAELTAYFSKVALEHEPGGQFSPSKLNYNLLGLLLENLSGKSYEQLLAEFVTGPLGMKNTSLGAATSPEANKAQGYLRRNYTTGWEKAPYLGPANTFAAQGILSTTEDLLLWQVFVKNNHARDKALQVMLKAAKENEYGYGLYAKRDKAGNLEEIRSGGGYSSGFNAFSSINLPQKRIVLVLSNNRNPTSGDIAEGLQAIFSGKKYTLPLPRKVVQVDATSLQKLAGAYKINEQVTINIIAEGHRLFVDDSMHPRFEVFPQSADQFFMDDIDAELLFIRNKAGVVTALGLRDDGFTNVYAKKVRE